MYFDYNATTPIDASVLDEMLPYLKEHFGNPSSIHAHGQQVRRGLDSAREQVASLIGASPEEIVFTSGATESNNYAISGVLKANTRKGNHIITSSIEHLSVLGTVHSLKMDGALTTHVKVDKFGLIDLDDLAKKISKNTVLISIMSANNDVGTIEPVKEIAEIAKKAKVLFHTDAVQAIGKISFNVKELNVDLASFSSHKLYGPKGVGALYTSMGARVSPLIHGGHQEFRKRAGTENIAGIIGFGKACEIASKRLAADIASIQQLRQQLERGLIENIKDAYIHGHPQKKLPGTVNISFKDVEGETLLMALDLAGISASTGSACTSANRESSSHVLVAMGVLPVLARSSLRLSLGRETTSKQVDTVIKVIKDSINRLRSVKVKTY